MLFSDISLFVDDETDPEKLFPLQMVVAKCKSRKQWPFSTLQSCVHDFVARQEKSHIRYA